MPVLQLFHPPLGLGVIPRLAAKLPCRWGNETLTIEVSSTSSVAPSITAKATSHLCEADRSIDDAVADGALAPLLVITAAMILTRLCPIQCTRTSVILNADHDLRHTIFARSPPTSQQPRLRAS